MPTPSETRPVRIELRGLVKRFSHQPVLNQLSLNINEGDFCLLVGDNGAGKTTLLRILAGLMRPSQGEVSVCQSSPSADPQVRQLIGYVGHETMLYQDLTAEENLRHYARLYQVTEMEAAISHTVQTFNLSRYLHRPVRNLSRGMQQRLALARATLHNPAILLMDEPHTGLDQEAAGYLDNILQGWHRPGRIILLAAHRPQRLLKIASHVAWLRDGGIFAHLPVKELSNKPDLNRYLLEVA